MLLVATGCKKTPIEQPMTATPDLRGSGLINDEPFEVAAGVNNFYMEASYERNPEGVNEFVGEFKKDNGESTALKIVIQDDERRLPVEPVSVDVAMTEGFYDFKTDEVEIDPFQLQFYSLAYADGDHDYLWELDGEELPANPSPEFPIVSFEEYTDFDIYVMVSDDSGCSDTLVQDINQNMAPDAYTPYFKVPFKKEFLTGGGVRFYYPGDVEQTTQIKWDVSEDGQNSTVNDAPEYTHYFTGDGPHRVAMNVIMEDGHAFKYVENVAPFQNTCAASIQYEAVPVNPDAVDVSQVLVEYVDEEGNEFSSFSPTEEENADRSFEILSVTDYNNTDDGLETRKVNVRFTCTLYNVNNPDDTMRIEDFTGFIAVSFPQ